MQQSRFRRGKRAPMNEFSMTVMLHNLVGVRMLYVSDSPIKIQVCFL